MKILALVLLCATAYLNNAAPVQQPVDYREKYDHLLMEVINERIREGEHFLERLTHQLKEYQTSHKEEDKAHILREVNFILPMVKGVESHFETELKKTGLDMLERFTIEKARDEGLLIVNALTEIQKQVSAPAVTNKSPVFYADTPKPVDYRNEYDRLLYATIQEHITMGDGMLLGLNKQLQEYQKSKNADIKAHVAHEVDRILPLLKMAEEHAQHELKRTDLNSLERFLYEKSQDEVALLIKHYTAIETAVKGSPTHFEYFEAENVTTTDWRSEYDRLLFEFIEHNIRRADELLVRLQRQLNEYKQTKDKNVVQRIASEVDFTAPLIKAAQGHAQTELKRTDLNHVERYLYEKANDEATILVKYYTAIEQEVKAAHYFELQKFYAPEDRTADVRTLEGKFADISHEVHEFHINNTSDAKTKIITEIEAELPKVKALIKDLETQLETTHGILERFHLEREIRALGNIERAYTREESRIKGSTF
jgi:hypothetical protein